MDFQVVVAGEPLVTNWAPDTFLVEGVKLMFVVHVMILSSDITKCGITHVALVHGLGVSTAEMIAQWLRCRETLLANVTTVRGVFVQISVIVGVAVKFQMLLQLETFVESLTTNLANRTDLARVFSHVVQQIFFLAKDITTSVAFVLYATSVNGNMLLQTIQTRKLSATNSTTEEATIILLSITRILNLGNFIIDLVVSGTSW